MLDDLIAKMATEAEQIRAALIQAAAAVQAAEIQANAAWWAGVMTLSAGALAIVAAVIGARAARRAAKIGVHHLEQKQIKERIIYMYYLMTKLDKCQTEFLNEGEILKDDDRFTKFFEEIASEEKINQTAIENMFPNSSSFVHISSPDNWKGLVEFYVLVEDMENCSIKISNYLSLWRRSIKRQGKPNVEIFSNTHASAMYSMRMLAEKLNEQICNERQSITVEPSLWKRFQNKAVAFAKSLRRPRT